MTIHADAYPFDHGAAHHDAPLPCRHDGPGQIHDQACRRVRGAQLGRHRAASADLDPDLIRAANYVHSLQLVSLARPF